MIDLNVTDDYRIVVPLRFRRFNHGDLPEADCPEIDSRGYLMARSRAWGQPTIRGPMFGVSMGDVVKVRVLREDLEDGCPLCATSSDSSVLAIENDDGRIDNEGELRVRGIASGTATIQVRLGSIDGPILAEADVRVHSLLRIPIKPWFVRIDSSAETGIVPSLDVDAVLNRCRAIWRPAGVHLETLPPSNVSVILPNGMVNTVNIEESNWASELAAVFRLKHSNGTPERAMDWFIIREFLPSGTPPNLLQTTGWGGDRRTVNSTVDPATGRHIPDTGIISATRAFNQDIDADQIANTTAHEVGHFFRLKHVRERNSDRPSPETYSRLQLMYPLDSLSGGTGTAEVPRFDNVGYGNGLRGALITMKNHEHHSTDGEVATARNTIQSDNWY